MEKPPPEKFNFISLSIFFFCIALFSCAEDKIDAPEVQSNIVFDFEDEKNPAQRLRAAPDRDRALPTSRAAMMRGIRRMKMALSA